MLGTSVAYYIDDILIYSKTIDEHKIHVREVLKLLEKANLYVKLSKCMFFQPEVTFVGHTLSKDGIKPDVSKVRVVTDWAVPTNVSELRRILGMVNFCRRYIYNFSEKSIHLFNLLKGVKSGKHKGKRIVPLQWGPKEQKNFFALKLALYEEPVLRLPDQSRRFTISTNPSDVALATVLLQTFDNGVHPVGDYSKKLSGATLNYTTHDKEMLAIVRAIEFWKH
jgi:hypothetical protein